VAREILAELRSHFGDKMLRTIINFNTKIKEASSFGQPISEYDAASKGQKDFAGLAREIIGAEAKQQRRQMVNSLTEQLESISTSATDLLEATKPQPQAVQSRQPKEQAEQQLTPTDIDAKLSDFYGVSQIGDAVAFVTLYPRANSVHIAGDFNNWQPEKSPLERVGDSGVWQTKIKLPQGKYRYRLVVDGQWQQDPYNELTELNPFGELNSILEVK
jgi:hypothetical protein